MATQTKTRTARSTAARKDGDGPVLAATDLQPAPVIGGSQRDQVPIASIGVA